MQKSTIKFGKNTVTKTSAPDLMRIEVEKTRRAFEIGRNCGLFRVPEVLDHDEEAGSAVFERLDVKPVSKTVPWGKRKNLAKILGDSLAIIHKELKLPDDMLVPLPDQFALPDEEVCLHGDLSVNNVCVGAIWPPVAIIDWQMTPLFGGHATCGTRYFDIFWFINNLISRPYTRFLFSNPVAPVGTAFIKSYFRQSQICYDPDRIVMYAKQFFDVLMPLIRQMIIRDSKGRARLLLPYSEAILKDFIESLKTLEPYK